MLYGSLYVLATLPIWVTAAILSAITMAAILVGRDILEGLPYNVAYSSTIGDAGLVIGALMAATILQRGTVYIPQWLQSNAIHSMIIFASVVGGGIVSVFTMKLRSGWIMDVYHDVIVAPLILYLAITLVPVIYYNGTQVEEGALVCFVMLWATLVVFDIKHDRMNQREWLRQNAGVVLRRRKL